MEDQIVNHILNKNAISNKRPRDKITTYTYYYDRINNKKELEIIIRHYIDTRVIKYNRDGTIKKDKTYKTF